MKAVKLSEPNGSVTLEDVEKPTPSDGEILVKMEASGLCYTDVHICDGDWAIVDAKLLALLNRLVQVFKICRLAIVLPRRFYVPHVANANSAAEERKTIARTPRRWECLTTVHTRTMSSLWQILLRVFQKGFPPSKQRHWPVRD
jgi:hypothetical protein